VDDTSPLRRFGFQARDGRRALKLTIAQAAGRLGRSEDYVRRVENGMEDITMHDADSLARTLGFRARLDLG
jgi:transcriptional regulator with XRE-family HTH domain